MTKVAVYNLSRMGKALVMLLALLPLAVHAQYRLEIAPIDKDAAFIENTLRLQTAFKNSALCKEYVDKLPGLMQSKGYPAASVDSVVYDTLSASLQLYVGETFNWARLNVDSIDKKLLEAVGWNAKNTGNKPVSFQQVQTMQQKMLDYLENNGYPFAKIVMDSVTIDGGALYANWRVRKGPLYKIDSIRNMGTAKISSAFLQRYLSIPNGSTYRRERLQAVSRKISELPYAQEQQPWNLTLLGTGSVLNVYLVPKRSSEVNVLVGFLPSSDQTVNNKLQITGEARINLKNALGNGESIGLDWQQIQVKSPRLSLSFQQPYLFGSAFGMNLGFNLFKKDSSFVNIDMLVGAQYALSSQQSGSVFIQSFQTNVLTVDTSAVKRDRRLPQEADMRSINIGVNYDLFNTDYRFNPRRGSELQLSVSAGNKKIKQNNVIVQLKDAGEPGFDFHSLYDTMQLNSYQFRIKGKMAQYFRLTRASTIKLGFNGGWLQSPQIFRNELFQIGGYKLLRGFDEESIFASQYGVGTLEYRYLLGRNSYLFYFIDAGWAANKAQYANYSNTFWGTGLGMAFETKAGIFNLSYAVGKRDDTKLNMRQAKIHLGYVNYF